MLRESPELFRASQLARGESVELVDKALDSDLDRRAAIAEFERLRAEQNAFGKRVSAASKEDKAELIAQAQLLAEKVKAASQAAADAEAINDEGHVHSTSPQQMGAGDFI